MKTTKIKLLLFACIVSCCSCEKEQLQFEQGDIRIDVEVGEEWLHDFPLPLGLTKKNPPQFAIWIETIQGEYISTLFVTHKIANEAWVANNGNRRKESLPHWCFQRGVVYEDGLMLPTKTNPLVDGISGATPKVDKTIKLKLTNLTEPFVIKAEFNHSVDFNNHFPAEAALGEDGYSGGPEGSGQPALIYSVTIFPGMESTDLELIGHSSPDGSDGNIYKSLERVDTAKRIVKRVTVTLI